MAVLRASAGLLMHDSRTSRPWTLDDELAFDIGFALPRAPIRGLKRAFTDQDRREIAKGIVAHLKLCGWRFNLPEPAVGHGTGKVAASVDDPIIAMDWHGSSRVAICIGRPEDALKAPERRSFTLGDSCWGVGRDHAIGASRDKYSRTFARSWRGLYGLGM